MQERISAEACGPALLKDEALTFYGALCASARKTALVTPMADAMPSPHAGASRSALFRPPAARRAGSSKSGACHW